MRTVSPSNPVFSVYAAQVEQIGAEIQGLRQELQTLEAEEQARERGDAARNLEDVRLMTLERVGVTVEITKQDDVPSNGS